jgi:hypothetical protein
MSSELAERLHERLHRLPGMPPHAEADRLNHGPATQRRHTHHHRRPSALIGRHPALGNPNAHHSRPPRVLVAWQNWIGDLLARRAHQG